MTDQPQPMPTPVSVFYSYAHEDEALRDELEKHLSLLRRQGLISEWHDRQIGAGTEWASQIDEHLETASLILLLISSDFLASDYCYGIEMQRAMQKHQAKEARVIPIILRPTDWNIAPFATLQALPTSGKPITDDKYWSTLDHAFSDVAKGIRQVVHELRRLEKRALESWHALDRQSPLVSSRTIVCIYAPRDQLFYEQMQSHLKLWERRGNIQWLKVEAGNDVENTTQTHLQQADLVLLLISPDFLAQDHCTMAMEVALQEQGRRQAPVVPIIARDCAWEESACGSLQALPDNELPIDRWNHPEQAYEHIREGLARFVPDFSMLRTTRTGRPRFFQVRDLPPGYVLRPQAFQAIKDQLLEEREKQTTAITTALRGAGGFGKTTLALALCHDSDVQAAFPDGILWVELGKNFDDQLLPLLNSLLDLVGPR